MQIDPETLRAFVAVSTLHSFTRAGHVLHRTQSTISHQIHRLETGLGVRLLERRTGSIALTVEGVRVLQYAQKILDLSGRMVHEVASCGSNPQIRIGLPDCSSEDYLAQVSQGIVRSVSGMKTTFRLGMAEQLRADVQCGDLDLAVVAAPYSIERSNGSLWSEKLCWVIRSDLQVDISRPVDLALCAAPCVNRVSALSALAAHGIVWRESVTACSQSRAMTAVRVGLGVGVESENRLPENVRCLGEADGFPPLPSLSYDIILNPLRSYVDEIAQIIHGRNCLFPESIGQAQLPA